MAWRRNHFQGQIGINDTSLTIAIENKKFEAAEMIIEATVDPSFLNDGPYENIPLHMVLTNNHHIDQSRNLKIAKMLVQKGANPNLRIPYGDMDRASPSPFEELVVYYEVLKSYVDGNSEIFCEELDMYFELEENKLEFLTDTVDFDGEKCMPNIESCHKLIKQTSDLIDVFLEYGSDPNVITTFAHKTLFHWVTEHEDIVLAKRFLDSCRVNLNLCDVHGNSPLMDTILRNDPENSLCLYEAMCDTVDFIDVNTRNCCGETALFRAVFVGAVDIASRLCEYGAQTKTNVCLSKISVSVSFPGDCLLCEGYFVQQVPFLTTPLLAPLLADAPIRLRYAHVSSQDTVSTQDCRTKITCPHKHLIDKIISSSIAPLIDLGCFNNQTVATEIISLLTNGSFKHLKDGRVQPTDLITLMFGQVTAGLQQLCIRSIFEYVYMVSPDRKQHMPDWILHEGAFVESCKTEMIESLGLPQSFKIFLEIEAAKYEVCRLIMGLQSVDCDQACSASEESMFDDDDDDDDDDESYDTSIFSSDYRDSLLFFSSDMLSEESSEEVEDLSDEDLSGSEEDEKEKLNDETQNVHGEVCPQRKVKCDLENLNSDLENMRDVVESLCEDVAESVAHEEHSSECCENYQRFKNESTTSTESAGEFTASEPLSDSSW